MKSITLIPDTLYSMLKRILLLFLLLPCSLFPQSFTGGFNFYMPPDDTASSKFLPKFYNKPILDQDFIEIDNDGHFALNGAPIRFWGTNLVAGGAFPEKTKAGFIAGRLRNLGFNLVRFHHMDNPWSNESLFQYGQSTRELNPASLDRLEYLISELKKNGVYANINLHVSRTFKESDGVESADSIVEFGKGVTLFDPQLIELQKEFAQQLLTHVNPYTGLSLANDPVMAMLEITNENSLYRIWRDGKLKSFSEGGWLIIRHIRMLDSLWNNFLFLKYGSTLNLASSWNNGSAGSGAINQIINGNFESSSIYANWQMELHETALASMMKDTANAYAGIYSAKINVANASSQIWHIQFKQIGLTFKKDSVYTLEFAARSDSTRKIQAAIMRDNAPYTFYTGKDFILSSQWKTYTFTFSCPEENISQGRVTFQFGQKGNYWIDEVILAKAGLNGLLAGESIESRNIKRIDFSSCGTFTDQRVKDISEFYIDIQNKYFESMRTFLKNNLGIKVPINGTNWNVGPADLTVQSKLDYIDNHSYWDHPSFPGEPWSNTNWFINNTSMTKSNNGGTTADLYPGIALKGKPYTISEYNHAFPNIYQGEALLFTSAYASFHDADALMFFDYNSSSADWETDRIGSYFSINRNNLMMALTPACAYAYRNYFIQRAKEMLLVSFNPQDILLLPKSDNGGWQSLELYPKKLSLLHAVRNEDFDADSTTDFSSFPPAPVNPYITDTDEIIYNSNGLLSVNTPKFIGASGFLKNFINNAIGPLNITSVNEFGNISWISLDGDSLCKSKYSLISIASKIQNSGMVWEGTTTIHNNWGTAPTTIYPLLITINLNIYADSIRIFPLDPSGKENPADFKTYYPISPDTFSIYINQVELPSVWFGIEKFGNGTMPDTNENSSGIIDDFRLYQNYPNPFNNYTSINYDIPYTADISIAIFDILGRKIKSLYTGLQQSGRFSIDWMGNNDYNNSIASGIYFVKFAADNFVSTKKIVLLK